MSSQEVVDFIQSKITQKDENGVLRPLSSIVEEVKSRAHPVSSFTLPSAHSDSVPQLHEDNLFRAGGIWQHVSCNAGCYRSRVTSELGSTSFGTLINVFDP